MASHVPFLAVRPDDQLNSSSDLRARDLVTVIKDNANAMSTPTTTQHAPPASRLPAPIRFFLVCVLSFALSTLLYSVTADTVGYELAAVSREVKEDWHVGVLFAWKFIELGGAWYAGYDWQDLTGLAILSNLPLYFLLTTFYGVDAIASTSILTIDVIAIAVPFALLRPLIHAHEPGKEPNQQVAQDRLIFALVGLLGASIYSVVIYTSLYTWLPVYLLTHFDGLRSMQKAHDASVPLLMLSFIPMGWATAQFLFTPSIGSRGNPGLTDPKIYPEKTNFDPETATIAETIAFNLGFKGGFTKRAEVLAKRSAVLIWASMANTFVRVLFTVDGTEALGAAGWASAWGVAALLTSVAYGFVGNE
ncbi:hypothetical protein LTR02_005409 [Friedmanniomyces endolithicus]|nr:hypothetical protein LTR94_007792 [Friedmanniomyces endolithicus]KAK0793437.1 hypothetical protein LTR38_009523 [Friedmanniomyces endolithicus]KAK0801888.1 hypothetical protein LTR59_005242 [Friedmanniomyces endolithicus]KAK0817413.1 hypothetical protein LTR75_003152 [Friedmanniomyces endolithicus]KAK0847501.1 hypothetical protein LTR03_006286 [Friedmanniomyces endolithicus]